MTLFTYKVKSKKGEIIEDVLQSPSQKDAAATLKSDGFEILTIKPLDSKVGLFFKGSISISEKAAFCRFLATMLRAGLTLPEAIEIIREETKNKKLQEILLDVSYQIRRGQSLSSALSKYKRDFDSVFLTLVKAGEESGSVDKSFDYLAKQLIASYELSQKVKGAMMYPAVIVAAMSANFVIMLVFVLPKLSSVFLQLDVELPLATRIVLSFGQFVEKNLYAVLGVTALLAIGIFLLMSIQKTKEMIMNFIIGLPAIRKVTLQIDIARFSRTLSTLLRSGVPIMVALDVASALLRLPGLKKQAAQFSTKVASGESLSDILIRGKQIFPSIVVQTIKAGEKSGSLEDVLEEMADFYEKEVDYDLKKLTSLLEPLLMLVIGLAVGAMVVIMITPIYSLVNNFG